MESNQSRSRPWLFEDATNSRACIDAALPPLPDRRTKHGQQTMQNAGSKPLPRILCFHGGGTSAQIFRSQLRTLLPHLTPYFRLVFTDGPLLCGPGPGMIPVYEKWGPYRRYLRWKEGEHAEIDEADACEEIGECIRDAMERDDGEDGGGGEWVGTLGFSQGAKVAASVVFERQVRVEREEARLKREKGKAELGGMYAGFDDEEEEEDAGVREGPKPIDYVPGLGNGRWRFAVCLAGRAPLIHLSPATAGIPFMATAADISEGGLEFDMDMNVEARLRWPSVHVHGMADPGLHLHRRLSNGWTYRGGDGVEDPAEVVEWDGGHRVPFKKADVVRVAGAIFATAVVRNPGMCASRLCLLTVCAESGSFAQGNERGGAVEVMFSISALSHLRSTRFHKCHRKVGGRASC